MKEDIQKLKSILEETPKSLSKISESESSAKESPGKWSKKEILGHLIDSASNNHQRFVRMQTNNVISFPAYQQESWVSVQHYQEEPWKELVHFWERYNQHIVHILTHIPSDKWDNHCIIGTDPPRTMSHLVQEYIKHLEHHLTQIVPSHKS